MGNFFGNIYYLFVGLFGQHLSDYLWGYNCESQGFDAPVVYMPVGFIMVFLTLFLCIVFYFLINHPRLNKWWHWVIATGLVLFLNWLIGGLWVGNHLLEGLIPDCLRYETLPNGDVIEHISSYNCWMFGLANGIVSIIWFTILSFVIKRWSRNCRHTPWRSIFPKRNK